MLDSYATDSIVVSTFTRDEWGKITSTATRTINVQLIESNKIVLSKDKSAPGGKQIVSTTQVKVPVSQGEISNGEGITIDGVVREIISIKKITLYGMLIGWEIALV
jgi:hypothetical protein